MSMKSPNGQLPDYIPKSLTVAYPQPDGTVLQLEYKLNGAVRDASPSQAKTQRGIFQESVMDAARYAIPTDPKLANKRFYTPITNLLRQIWFMHMVTVRGKATNADFDERYKSSKFTKDVELGKYGTVAINAVSAVVKEAKEQATAANLTNDSIASLEKICGSLIQKTDYIGKAHAQYEKEIAHVDK